MKNSKDKMKEVNSLNIAHFDEQTAQPLENSFFFLSSRVVIVKSFAGFSRSGPVYPQYRRRNEGCNRHGKEQFSQLQTQRTSVKAI